MELILMLAPVAGFLYLKSREQQRRIALLASYLGRFDIEKLMQALMEGYLRALDEKTPERQAQVWQHLQQQEDMLAQQLNELAQAFQNVWSEHALVSTLPLAFPWAHKLAPKATFDLRQALNIQAQGIARLVSQVEGSQPAERAYTLMAEMMLLQHTCHWFCRSKAIASVRLLKRHQTSYEQVLAGVSAQTRQAYLGLIAYKG
jgi:hypothetical protein